MRTRTDFPIRRITNTDVKVKGKEWEFEKKDISHTVKKEKKGLGMWLM